MLFSTSRFASFFLSFSIQQLEQSVACCDWARICVQVPADTEFGVAVIIIEQLFLIQVARESWRRVSEGNGRRKFAANKWAGEEQTSARCCLLFLYWQSSRTCKIHTQFSSYLSLGAVRFPSLCTRQGFQLQLKQRPEDGRKWKPFESKSWAWES